MSVDTVKPSSDDQHVKTEPSTTLDQPEHAGLAVQPADEGSNSAPKHQNVEATAEEKPNDKGRHFYLLKPHTPSHQAKVLILLDPSKSLFEQLHNQVVLEFPTIIVLPQSPSNLPPDYILEDDFYRRCKTESGSGILDTLVSHVGHEGVNDDVEKKEEAGRPEEDKILEAMRKDLGPTV